MAPAKKRPLSRYYERLRTCKLEFACPQCSQRVTSKLYEKHCLACHQLNPELQCVWCQGAVSWTKRTKWHHIHHLLDCWKRFILSQAPPVQELPRSFSSDFVLDDLTPLCPERQWFGRSSLAELPPLAYDTFSLVSLDPLPLPFQDDGLNWAAGCVRQYLHLPPGWACYHILVRAVAFSSFLHALEEHDAGHSQFLPFSCWCDGGRFREARHRQHRHMLLFSPVDHFIPNVWKRIQIPRRDRPCKHFYCIRLRQILTPLHLVNAMGYLSQRPSTCHGSFQHRGRKAFEQPHHFWILKALPACYRLYACLQWDGGILELIRQEYRFLTPEALVHQPLVRDPTGLWQIAVKHLPGILLNRVLRVAPTFRPTSRSGQATETYLHLNRGFRLYFERDDSLLDLDPETWCQRQASLGNLFYGAIGDELWTPRPYLQQVLNALEPARLERDALREALRKQGEEVIALQEALRKQGEEKHTPSAPFQKPD